jgi:beta-glucosidase/6-phospho-beta-glucosidase/beta-galactosidase
MFESFFLAGFECATGHNVHGEWIDQVAATQHDRFADKDYRLIRDVGIRAAREAIRWPLVDRRGRHDFSSVVPMVESARRHGVEVIYDLFHYGYPSDVHPFDDDFVRRFADYCHSAARFVRGRSDGPCYFTPVNEPSFFAWAGGEVGLFAPHATGRGPDLKFRLAEAAIAGIDAIWAACPDAQIVNVDAICRVVPPADAPDMEGAVAWFNEQVVFESLDMIGGRLYPELGGSPRHLGVVGVNYYWTNQWELGRDGAPLPDEDPRRAPLRDIIRNVWERYGVPVLISETSHVGEKRGPWLREVASEVEALLGEGVPLLGVCLYPILGMPEWHAQTEWTYMGLWDLEPDGDALVRTPHVPMLEALREAQDRIESQLGWDLLRKSLVEEEGAAQLRESEAVR